MAGVLLSGVTGGEGASGSDASSFSEDEVPIEQEDAIREAGEVAQSDPTEDAPVASAQQ